MCGACLFYHMHMWRLSTHIWVALCSSGCGMQKYLQHGDRWMCALAQLPWVGGTQATKASPEPGLHTLPTSQRWRLGLSLKPKHLSCHMEKAN